MKRIEAAFAATAALGALAAPIASADSTKTCTTSGSPHKNFTTTSTQTPACNSNSSVNQQVVSVSNAGGHQPPGQQP